MHQHLLLNSTHEKAKCFFSSKDEYENKLLALQQNLILLQREIHNTQKKVIILFEGPDASGKGGVIKRLTSRLDPRGIQVHSIGKPTEDEKSEHYMQRFWRKLPMPGMITVFDRSWYGRILVEPVEKLITDKEKKRAYKEINNFEKLLIDDGYIILKYFLDISYDEQAARFIDRKNNPFKAWKLTPEDARNRKKWKQYYIAFKDMIRLTNSGHCKWLVVASDSKWFSRVSVLNDILKRITNH